MSYPSVRLGDVAEIEREGVNPAVISIATNYVGLEHISSDGSFSEITKVEPGDLASTKFAFSDRHVLFGKLRPYLRKTARPSFSGICSTDIIPIVPSRHLTRDYLFHFLRTDEIVSKATAMSSGANLPRISPKHLVEFEIPLPSLHEQRRIAAILDQADALRHKQREIIATANRLSSALFAELVGDTVGNPNNFDRIKLVECCEYQDDIRCGPFGTQLLKDEFQSTGTALWGIKQVNRHFKVPTLEFVSSRKAEQLSNYDLRPMDIVMTRKGTVGNCAIFPSDFPVGIMHSDLLRIRLNTQKHSAVFMAEQLRSSAHVMQQIELISGGAIMPGINVGKLKSIRVLAPPKDLQEQFSIKMEGMAYVQNLAQARNTQFNSLFSSLQQRAFCGEL